MTFLASISTNILRIDPSELVPSPASHEARRRILAAGDAYQADIIRKASQKARAAEERTSVEALDTLACMVAILALQVSRRRFSTQAAGADSDEIISQVARKHALTPEDLKGHRRSVNICRARHEAFYRLSEECRHLSLPAIGRICGGYDHSSVSHGLRRHAELYGLKLSTRKPGEHPK